MLGDVFVPSVRGHHVAEMRSIFRNLGEARELHKTIDSKRDRLWSLCCDGAFGVTADERAWYVRDILGDNHQDRSVFERYVSATFDSLYQFARLAPEELVAIIDAPDMALCGACVIGMHCNQRPAWEADQLFLNSSFYPHQLHQNDAPSFTYALVPSIVIKSAQFSTFDYALSKEAIPQGIQILTSAKAAIEI
jgi:hypothetical protein